VEHRQVEGVVGIFVRVEQVQATPDRDRGAAGRGDSEFATRALLEDDTARGFATVTGRCIRDPFGF
jgi:hypothetical protein